MYFTTSEVIYESTSGTKRVLTTLHFRNSDGYEGKHFTIEANVNAEGTKATPMGFEAHNMLAVMHIGKFMEWLNEGKQSFEI